MSSKKNARAAPPANKIPETLTELLRRRGVTVAEVAAGTGFSRQAVYQILSGRTATPKRATLEKIATFLGVTRHQLLTGEDPGRAASFLTPDADILAQIPEVVGPELEAMIAREFPDAAPLRLGGPSREAHQDILKMKLYLILKKRKLAALDGEPPKPD